MPFFENMLRKTKAKFDIIAPMKPTMSKLSSVTAASAQPPMMGSNDMYTPAGNVSPSKNLETTTLKAGSALLIIWVNETATFDMLTVAATCPIVCATATGNRAFQKSKSVLGVSAILIAQDTNIIKEPMARDRVEVNQG
uniref:Uncharacterized protein n=1 Tax=Opuntia streptacantha TaxID=393608 RepID=A0A7C8ZVR9_OPUST